MKLFRVHQHLASDPIGDVTAEVFSQLDNLGVDVPQGEVALTAGSRGISNIAPITKAVGEWLRRRGAQPFLVPCMGSHNGATAEGQRAMVESIGITEAAMGMEIRSDMDVVELGRVASGSVYMDRHCDGVGAVFVINRIKLHTCFSGPVQSGLMKMMVIGMGKIPSARTFHRTRTALMGEMIVEMGRKVLDSEKILGGLAILEDGFGQTAEIHAIAPKDIPMREPALLERYRRYFARLPVNDLNVLVVDSIGKNYSGTGMDTNVLGYRGVKGFEDLAVPSINVIAALSLAEESYGNGIGVGLADFITRTLRDAIDEEKTFINVFTTGDMARAKIPATLPDDETLIRCIVDRYGDERWMFIPNTAHLETLYVSEDLAQELVSHPDCDVDFEAVDLTFDKGRHTLQFR